MLCDKGNGLHIENDVYFIAVEYYYFAVTGSQT